MSYISYNTAVEEAHERSARSSVIYAGMPAERAEPFDTDETRRLFANGSYTEVVVDGDRESFEYAASLAMIAKKEAALAALSRFATPEALFYIGVSHWIDGDEGKALEFLGRSGTEHALRLLALIKKPRLRVLTCMLWQGLCGSNITDGMFEDPKFICQNIGFEPGDLPARPYASIHEYYNASYPPDFFIAREVEWYNFPPNLQEIPCPLFAHTSDFDAHVQTVSTWFNLFDQVIVCNHFARNFLAPMIAAPVCTYPKSYSVAPFYQEILPDLPRDIDLYISGNTLMPYHPDKAVMLHQLLDIPEEEAAISMESYTSSERYRELMNRSKVSVVYVRDYGGMPTRALEALSMGCAVAIQRGCVLSLFLGEEEGVLQYSADRGDARQALRRILDDWPTFERRVQRGREIVKREFSRGRIASQYLRFLTVLAAKPRVSRALVPREDIHQKRLFFLLGLPTPPYYYNELLHKSETLLEERLRRGGQVHHLIDLARERILRHADQTLADPRSERSAQTAATSARSSRPREDFDQALRIYRIGLEHFPKSLVNRFNFIRCLCHFGTQAEVEEALALAESTVLEPRDGWQIDPRDDLFPYDFFSNMFNYREYCEAIVKNRRSATVGGQKYAALILASIHHYLSFYRAGVEHSDWTVSLDPSFPIYKYRYALKLAQRGQDQDYAKAGTLLMALSRNSLVFEEAYRLLDQLVQRGHFSHADLPQLQARMLLTRRRLGSREKNSPDLVTPQHLQCALPEVALR